MAHGTDPALKSAASWKAAKPQLYAKAKITVNKAQAPFAIDYYHPHGSSSGQKQLGIYELHDGTLTLCLAPAGTTRPMKFESIAGDGATFVVWRRT